MGIDWISVLGGALAGGFAAAMGVGFGRPIGELFAVKKIGTIVTVVIAISVFYMGSRLVQPGITAFLDTNFGVPARKAEFDAVYERDIQSELAKYRAFKRIFADFPEREAAIKERFRASYESGGEKQVIHDSVGIGATLADAASFYLPRATDHGLVAYIKFMGDMLSMVGEKDPEACVLLVTGAQLGHPLEGERYIRHLSPDLIARQMVVLDELIADAEPEPVKFDPARAQSQMSVISLRLSGTLDAKAAEVVAGQRLPANAAEAKAACDFMTKMMNEIASLGEADGGLVMRALSNGSGGAAP